MIFGRVFWSIFWRWFIIFVINNIIAYGVSYAAFHFFEETASFIKYRMSLSLLPSALMFAVLVNPPVLLRNSIFERNSLISPDHWHMIYFSLSVWAFFNIILILLAGRFLDESIWLELRIFLPVTLFLLFWIAATIFYTWMIKTDRLANNI